MMKHPHPDILAWIARGDAFGAAAEYLRFPRDQETFEATLRFDRYLAHPTHGQHEAGRYTDDGQMSAGVAEVLLEEPGVRGYSQLQFANAFVRAFRRDPRKGYAGGFQNFLESDEASTGERFLLNIEPSSTKNGAAMRSVPIGVLPHVGDVVMTAHVNASITHNTQWGRFSSMVVALLSHFALYTNEPFEDFYSWCLVSGLREFHPFDQRELERMWNETWQGPVCGQPGTTVAQATVHAVIHLLRTTTSLRESMLEAIRLGGDVDTVMAIVWGIQSIRVRDPVPDWLVYGLEDGPYGRRFLENLGARLMDKYA